MIIFAACMFSACSGRKKDNTDNNVDQTAAVTSEEDTKFTVEVAAWNVRQVELSFFAKDKLTNGKVKELDGIITANSSKAVADLMAVAKDKKISLPVALNSDGQKDEDELGAHTGSDLDKTYIEKITEDSKQAEKLYENASVNAKDKDIKNLAVKALSVAKQQLTTIKAVQDNMK